MSKWVRIKGALIDTNDFSVLGIVGQKDENRCKTSYAIWGILSDEREPQVVGPPYKKLRTARKQLEKLSRVLISD